MPALPANRASRRAAFTLIELLISVTVAMLIILAMIEAFRRVGDSVTDGRALLEMNGQLRTASMRLEDDLAGVTSSLRPSAKPGAAAGYFEYFEGNRRDMSFTTDAVPDSTVGDFDDVLMFTSRARGVPFVGRILGGVRRVNPADPTSALMIDTTLNGGGVTTIESDLAEIIWWVHVADQNGNNEWDAGEALTIRRRVLLIRPDLILPAINSAAFFADFDISAREITTMAGPQMIANTLADLGKREHRFAHAQTFPHALPLQSPRPSPADITLLQSLVLGGAGQGEDIVLPDVRAFDVKVYDPYAPVEANTKHAVDPSDTGYVLTSDPMFNSGSVLGRGAFVDLNYDDGYAGVSLFAGAPATKSQLNPSVAGRLNTYCTWSSHYERDGIDQDLAIGDTYGVDQGTNGKDDNSSVGVDDITEHETSPPYPVPLRGLKVTLRMIDPGTQQIRQVSTVKNFVPE